MKRSNRAIDYIYIVGVGRSGTSLLQSMLGSHSEIKTFSESSFFRNVVLKNLTPTGAEVLRRGVPGVRITKEIRDLCEKNYEENVTPEVYFDHIIGLAGGRIVLEKDPRLCEEIERVLCAMPNSRILYIRRNQVDVIASKKNADWSRNQSFLRQLTASVYQLLRANKNRNNTKVKFVLFEDLILRPVDVLRDIMNFLELEYEPSMLNYADISKEIVSSEELQWKERTLQPLDSGRLRSGYSSLPNHVIFATEKATRRYYPYGAEVVVPFPAKVLGGALALLAIVLARVADYFRRYK